MAEPDFTFSWTDIEDIALALLEAYPDVDPLGVKFTELRELVEGLEGFEAEEGQSVNEQILEAIQVGWHEERLEENGSGDGGEDGESSYEPNNPYR
ncbi:Fe-S cluster assembly protein IscX [Poriferisphaera sp. WC338]|uniref:Fe-S cluster assembly protein IscX n=1 Tax=Poriferisphaera sp. WC338 TaxID=3425129 RepID=UPI003D818606